MNTAVSSSYALFLLLAAASHACAEEPPASAEPPPRFDVMEFRIQGHSKLDSRLVEKTVYPFLGPKRSVEDVEQARAALEKAYHDAGYSAAAVDIPEQDVKNGIVYLKLGEGTVDRLKVTGSRYFLPSQIRAQVPALAEGQVLHMPEAQAQLEKLGMQSPDRLVTPIMRAGRTPGTLEVDLNVEDTLPLHGGVEMNGRNSVSTARTRLSANLRYDNLWQRFHSASLQYQIAPENPGNLEVWSGTYVLPTGFWDARLAFYGVGLQSRSNSIATTGSLTVVGTGEIYGLRLVKPLQGGKAFSHSVTLGWDYKDFGQSIGLLGADTQNTPIHYSPFHLAYSGSYGHGDGSLSTFNLEANVSFQGLGNDPQEFADKRYDAKADYLYVGGEIRHTQMLPRDFRLSARLSGQVTDSPLISHEQFGAGGWQSVRGYHETEALGDDGVNASVELYGPDLIRLGSGDFGQFRFLAFAELARLWNRSVLSGTPPAYFLSSAGMGFRAVLWKHWIGEFDWAYPLSAASLVGVGDQRVDFRVGYEF